MSRRNTIDIGLLGGLASAVLMHASYDAHALESAHREHADSVHVHDAHAVQDPHDEHARSEHQPGAPAGQHLPRPDSEQRAAAFPDLGDRDIHATLHDDPFVTLLRLERLEVRDADAGTLTFWDAKVSAGRDLAKQPCSLLP